MIKISAGLYTNKDTQNIRCEYESAPVFIHFSYSRRHAWTLSTKEKAASFSPYDYAWCMLAVVIHVIQA